MKSEPDESSVDDVLAAPGRKTPWTGVRNYQARNTMRDAMCVGDGVASAAYPDPTQFERKSPYFDPKATRDAPRWFSVDVRATRKTRLVPLAELHAHKALAAMAVLRRGNRLSITPVSAAEWRFIEGRLL